ncbi:MAG: class I tRNA ligase family protein [Candidatus Sumerlaeota bacterium]|nr:class I tRNA ligase family protein [Candidatus Sumerlaeota bacterium]
MSDHGYQPTEIEKKWQKYWDEHGTNQADLEGAKKPYYVLMMFPYPSAEGLHVGNVYAFTGADIQGRYYRLRGYDVFEPIGFDAFGIHSENYALKVGRHPLELIPSNTRNFTRQLKMMGLMYDWRQVVDTTSPEYYRWTQWIFVQLFKAGLAVRKEAPVTWCPDCKTVISDEFIDANDCCDRHPNTKVEKRNMTQWFFRITEYAARLHENLDWIDWSDSTRKMQRDWIGRSDGAEVDFTIEGSRGTPDRETLNRETLNRETPDRETPAKKIRVFTTRPDTLFGATYMVLAPEHPLVDEIASPAQRSAVAKYRAESVIKTEIERATDVKLKTGVFTGARAINPLTGEAIPIWVSDYVMMGYGTGAIMAVPAHDTRDFAFAKTFHLPIRCILDPDVAGGDGECLADLAGDRKALLATEEGRRQIREWVLAGEECWAGPGRAINSANTELTINGLPVPEAKKKATEFVAAKSLGEAKINFRLRDWCISRQRYWGPPIPMIHCPKCGVVPVPDDQLRCLR